jgi:hypothetical protein
MPKVSLKPSFLVIATMWLIIGFAILIFLIARDPAQYADLQLLALGIIFVAVRCLILSLIFYLIPYFRIEVNDTDVIGPGPAWAGWNRVKIPLTEIDRRRVKSTIPWLGFYRIDSDGYGKITVWWFDEQQLDKLLAAIAARKGAGTLPALASA